MKMIASTKLNKAQRAMLAGKEYGIANAGTCLCFDFPKRQALNMAI